MPVTPTHLDGGCLARQMGLSGLVVTPVYLNDGALVVTRARVAIGHIGPPSSPGVASDPVIFVPGHRSGQSSPVNILSFSLLITLLVSVCNYVLVNSIWSIQGGVLPLLFTLSWF